MSQSSPQPLLVKSLTIAALANGSLLFFALDLFPSLSMIDPHFDRYGCLLIALWGLAYFASRKVVLTAPELFTVFAVEKGAYVLRWCWWIQSEERSLASIYEEAPLSGVFFSIYGVVDLCFMLCFTGLALRGWKLRARGS